MTWLPDEDSRYGRVPPAPRSQMRVLAVMGATVLGCGFAAVGVILTPVEGDHADHEPVVVVDSSRTSAYLPPETVVPTTADLTSDRDVVTTEEADVSAGMSEDDRDPKVGVGNGNVDRDGTHYGERNDAGSGEDASTASAPPRRPAETRTSAPPPDLPIPSSSSSSEQSPPPAPDRSDDQDDAEETCWLWC